MAGLVALSLAQTAHAAPYLSSSLQDLNTTRGTGVATTTTDATGRRTTVVGGGGDANRVYGTPAIGSWFQSAVGGGGTVGITTDYARNGNGSAFFSTINGDSKGDLQYYFSTIDKGFALSSLTSLDYEFYRNGASTTGANLAPVMRLDIAKNGAFAGSLVFENVYQTQQPAPTDTWTELMATLNTGIFWATNTALGPTFASANGGQKTLAAWIADNAGSTLSVYGMSIGVGSGFDKGTFSGAIDTVDVAFANGPALAFNFEAAPTTAVPEPASLVLALVGLGGTALLRRRKA